MHTCKNINIRLRTQRVPTHTCAFRIYTYAHVHMREYKHILTHTACAYACVHTARGYAHMRIVNIHVCLHTHAAYRHICNTHTFIRAQDTCVHSCMSFAWY